MHHEIDFSLLKTSQGTSEQTEKFWTSEAILKKKKKDPDVSLAMEIRRRFRKVPRVY